MRETVGLSSPLTSPSSISTAAGLGSFDGCFFTPPRDELRAGVGVTSSDAAAAEAAGAGVGVGAAAAASEAAFRDELRRESAVGFDEERVGAFVSSAATGTERTCCGSTSQTNHETIRQNSKHVDNRKAVRRDLAHTWPRRDGLSSPRMEVELRTVEDACEGGGHVPARRHD